MAVHEWPQADYGGAWAELRGYVQQAADDGTVIEPAAMLAYLDELKHKALAPVRDWMDSVLSADEEGEDMRTSLRRLARGEQLPVPGSEDEEG